MEPQPQLQPVNPRPQLQYAEPPPRPLELKPGPRPLDLRPRPSARPQLDIKYGPASPAEQAAARANPLGNPLRVVEPVINNPLGYTPGKGVISFAAGLLQNATDPETFGVPVEEFEEADTPALPSPFLFPVDAIEPGPEVIETIPAPYSGGQMPGVTYMADRVNWWYSHTTPQGEDRYVSQASGLINSSSFRAVCGYSATLATLADGSFRLTRSITSSTNTNTSNVNFPVGTKNIKWGGTVTFRRQDGATDTGGDPAPLQQGQRVPNRIREADPEKGPVPLEYPEPGTRERTPFLPIPTFRYPELPTTAPEFVPYAPPSETDLPEIRPVNPDSPTAPTKFPPPATAPELPGKLDNPTQDTTGRRLVPPFIPVFPGTTPPEILPPTKTPPIIIPIPPLRRGDCCADEVVMRESQRIRDILDDLKDRILSECQDLCDPALMTTTECQEINGKLRPVSVFRNVLTLSEGLEVLAAEIATINQQLNPCGEDGADNVPFSLLASGSMSAGSTVSYVEVPDEVQQVELIITGSIPNDLRLYDTTLGGEQQGKFGSICVAYPGVVGGNAPDAFHQWAWTRRTLLNLSEPTRPGRKVRIYLRAGLSWVLYDTGVRK